MFGQDRRHSARTLPLRADAIESRPVNRHHRLTRTARLRDDVFCSAERAGPAVALDAAASQGAFTCLDHRPCATFQQVALSKRALRGLDQSFGLPMLDSLLLFRFFGLLAASASLVHRAVGPVCGVELIRGLPSLQCALAEKTGPFETQHHQLFVR
jgi:hypothetical protein